MINASAEFKQKLNNNERDYLCQAKIELSDGTILELENDRIMLNGFSVENAVSEDSSFTALGSVIVDSATLIIYNLDEYYSDYVFENATVILFVGLELSNTTENIRKGTFIVNEATYSDSTITLNLFDNINSFDKSYTQSTLTYPATLLNIVQDACSNCGVVLATNSVNFPHNTYTVAEKPNAESTTFREVLSWVATIAGCFARCNINGELELTWFDVTSLINEESGLDGGVFDEDSPYSTGDTADGGTFNPWTTGAEIDGGTFTSNTNVHYINQLYSQNIAVDDVVITGVRITIDSDDSDDNVSQEHLFGTDGYVIEITNNPFITSSTVNTVGAWLQTLLVGLTFRPCDVSHTNTPIIEAGDVGLVWDKKGDSHPILITRVNFIPTSPQTIVCGAESPTKNSSVQFTETTKAFIENAKKIKENKKAINDAYDELSTRLTNAGGLYYTVVPQTGGGYKTYYHNKPNLADSNIQLVISDVGITVTSNGTDTSPTWYGLTVDGQYIASIMNTIGINFDWGVGGKLIIKRDNVEVLYADADTGTVRLSSGSVIGGWTAYTTRLESDLTGSNGLRSGMQNGATYTGSSAVFYAGCNTPAGGTIANPANTNWYVRQDGVMYSKTAYLGYTGANDNKYVLVNNTGLSARVMSNGSGSLTSVTVASLTGSVTYPSGIEKPTGLLNLGGATISGTYARDEGLYKLTTNSTFVTLRADTLHVGGNKPIAVRLIQKTNQSIGAAPASTSTNYVGTGKAFTFNVNTPSGYRFLGITSIYTNHGAACKIGAFYTNIENDTLTVYLVNQSSTAFSDLTISIRALYVADGAISVMANATG